MIHSLNATLFSYEILYVTMDENRGYIFGIREMKQKIIYLCKDI